MNIQATPHITLVRQSLLDTLADLRNREQPMEIGRARAIAEVASVLVETAKVENDYLKITGQDRSQFLEQPSDMSRLDGPVAHNPFPRVIRHALQG